MIAMELVTRGRGAMNDQEAVLDIANVASKEELIRLLAKLRLRGDPEAAQAGISEQFIDRLSGEKLSVLPESTIVGIVETYFILKHKAMADDEIFQRIDMQRSLFGQSAACPAGPDLRSYIDFRLKVEHVPLGGLDDAIVEMAMLYAIKWFSADKKTDVDWKDAEAFAARAVAGTREKYLETSPRMTASQPGGRRWRAWLSLLIGVALTMALATYYMRG